MSVRYPPPPNPPARARAILLFATAILVLGAAGVYFMAAQEGPEEPAQPQVYGEHIAVPVSAATTPGYEDELAAQLDRATPPWPTEPVADFRALTREAIGLDAFQVADKPPRFELYREVPVAKGKLLDLRLPFSRPPIATRALWWQHEPRADELVILLHGHNTTAERALGLGEPDYMRAIGKTLFDDGFDVLALDLSRDGVVSGYINARLTLWGGQLYGLWVASVQAARLAVNQQADYRRTLLYGLSNGGFIAGLAALFDPGFDLVVVDDILTEWRSHAAAETNKLFQHQQYAIYFRNDFLRHATAAAFIAHARSPIVYTRTRAWFDEHLAPHLRPHFQLRPLAPAEGSAHLVYKATPAHEPEPELLLNVLHERWQALAGLTFR